MITNVENKLPIGAKLQDRSSTNRYCIISKPVIGSKNIEPGYIIHIYYNNKPTTYEPHYTYISNTEMIEIYDVERFVSEKRNNKLKEILNQI